MGKKEVTKGKKLIKELAALIEMLGDVEVGELLTPNQTDVPSTEGILNILLSIFDRSKIGNYPNVGEFLIANKIRWTTTAKLRYFIDAYCVIESEIDGERGIVSPTFVQWFEDGIMLLEGPKPFEGYLCFYKDNEQKIAIATRDVRPGEQVAPDGFQFVSIEEFNSLISHEMIEDLDKPLVELRQLLQRNQEEEVKYQEFLEKHPWVFGARYRKIQRHITLDDENIPDFTGVRAHDGFRDIFEIKQPFLTLFRKDGGFTSDFNDAWNQAERYLDFTRENKDYLRRNKGLNFENPKCYLVAGYNLSENERAKIRVKERGNPAIEIYTFNDLLVVAESTVNLAKQLKAR